MFRFANEDCETKDFVVVEDNGRFCYAYYCIPGRQIVSSVWLYNRCEAPTEPGWGKGSRGPYANPADHVVSPMNFTLPKDRSEVSVRWLMVEKKLLAEILVGKTVIGRLTADDHPGWARAAATNGFLANVMLM